MSFQDKYELVDLIEDGPAKVFVARELATGRKLGAFLFVGEQARAQTELIRQLHAIDPRDFPELIELGDNEGTPYVVTLPLGSFAELKAKVAAHKSAPPAGAHKRDNFTRVGVWHVPPATPPASAHPPQPAAPKPSTSVPSTPPEPPQHIPGEFTRMFQSSAPPMDEADKHAPSHVEAEPHKPAPPAEPVAGEFTRMFQSPEPPRETLPGTAPSHPIEQPEPAPGEFTRIFQAPVAPIGEPKQPPHPAAEQPAPAAHATEPGEFTKLFQAAPQPPPGSTHVPDVPPSAGEFTHIFGSGGTPPAAHAPQGTPGEFTRFFESASPGAVQPQQPPAAIPPGPAPRAYEAPGEFTRVFGSAAPPEVSAPAAASKAPEPASPGEYTRMFGAQSSPEPPTPAAVQTPAPAPAPKSSKLPLVLIVVALVVLAVIAVLVVTMSK